MWAAVETQLVHLLSQQIYPHLLTDPGYRSLLYEAGLATLPGVKPGQPVKGQFTLAQSAWYQGKPMQYKAPVPSTDQLTPAQRQKLHSVAQVRARLMLMDIKDLNCVSGEGAAAKLLQAKGSIYRVWDATSGNQTRNWWFSEAIKHQAIQESKNKGISPGDWIRDALAVSLDFGKCDRLSRISMEDLGRTPIIEAIGLPMSQRTAVHRNAGGETIGIADDDYWLRLGKTFRGGKTQYFVPYLPPEFIKPDAWT